MSGKRNTVWKSADGAIKVIAQDSEQAPVIVWLANDFGAEGQPAMYGRSEAQTLEVAHALLATVGRARVGFTS